MTLAAVYALLCLAGEELTGKALKNLQQSLYLVTLGTLAMWAFALLRAGRLAVALGERAGGDGGAGEPEQDRALAPPSAAR